jgi:large subunit ribosomal protein L7/L12
MTDKLTFFIEELKKLTLTEASELVKEIEHTFGVDTSVTTVAPVSMESLSTSVVTPPPVVEEQTEFDLILNEVSQEKKIAILKVVRQATGLGLKESKDIVDSVPKEMKRGISKEEAESLKKELEALGAKVTIK